MTSVIDPSQTGQPTQQAADIQQDDKQKNLVLQRKMYERQLEQERREKEELKQRIEQIEQDRKVSKHHADDDDDAEPYVDRRTLKRELERRDKDLDQKIDRKAEEKARLLVEQERINSFLRQNNDFEQILAPEIVQKFAEKFPDIAEPMLEMPDNFARKKLLYQNIKALGLHKPPENKPTIQETVDKNRRSPYYIPSGQGAPPYAQVGDFSQTGQKSAYAKMQDLIKARRG